MSKITKTIAALGVVAGLGVAALPLASYADSPDSKPITVNANIGSSFSLTVDKNAVTLAPTNNGPVVNTETDGGINATVTSNNANGYTLVLTGTEDYSLADGSKCLGCQGWQNFQLSSSWCLWSNAGRHLRSYRHHW